MPAFRRVEGSPLRTFLSHFALGLLALVLLLGAGLATLSLAGGVDGTGPRSQLPLFSENGGSAFGLRDANGNAVQVRPIYPRQALDAGETEDGTEPSLDVGDLSDLDVRPPPNSIAGQELLAREAAEREAAAGTNGGVNITVSGQAPRARAAPLKKAPLSGFHESGPGGPLPIIAADGRSPAEAYARPFSNPMGKPAISVVVSGLGLNRTVTKDAIEKLPAEITLSFVPYARDLQYWIDLARANGHEVLIELPMEPYDYPNNDTGPYTLLTTSSADENTRRLNWLLTRGTGFFGVTNYQGAKFATDMNAAIPVFQALSRRGLAFVHDAGAPRSTLGQAAGRASLPFVEADRIIDAEAGAEAIDEKLLHLEALAMERGYALGSGFAYPVTITQLSDWANGLEAKGYILAPASSLMITARP